MEREREREREKTDCKRQRTSWGKILIFPALHSRRRTITVKEAILHRGKPY